MSRLQPSINHRSANAYMANEKIALTENAEPENAGLKLKDEIAWRAKCENGK